MIRKLYQLAVREIYYFYNNTAHKISAHSDYYCDCHNFSGCEWKNGRKLYCFVCRIEFEFDGNELEKCFDIKKIINTYIKLKKTLEEYYNYDPTTNFYWLDDYTEKWRMEDGIHIWSLENYVFNSAQLIDKFFYSYSNKWQKQ